MSGVPLLLYQVSVSHSDKESHAIGVLLIGCINSLCFLLQKTTPCLDPSWCQDILTWSNLSMLAHDSCGAASVRAGLTHQGPYYWGYAHPYYNFASLSEVSHLRSHSLRVVVPTGCATWRHRACTCVWVFACCCASMPMCCCCPCAPVACTPFRSVHPTRCTLHCSQVAQGAKVLPHMRPQCRHAQFEGLIINSWFLISQ